MPQRGEIEFECDAFISYAHIDNEELPPDHNGWVTDLHRALEIRVAQFLGRDARIWRDPTLQHNDDFAKKILEQVKSAAALIAVVSPRYVRSEWARTELTAFCQAAEGQGGLLVGDKARVFKVLKTPVERDEHPPELQPFLGYEFFKADPDTGRMREFWCLLGPEAERDFWLKLDDLAHDVSGIVELLEAETQGAESSGAVDGEAVYLAVTTSDLREQRDAVKRGLEQHGYTVLPNRPLPLALSEIEAAVREDLARSRLSIHLIGRTYSLVPEGALKSLLEIQNDLAIERAAVARLPRLLWIPPGLTIDDERQRMVVQALRMEPHVPDGTDLLETSIEDLQTLVQTRLRAAPAAGARVTVDTPTARAVRQVYLIFDKRDADAIKPWADLLFAQGVEVIRSAFEGDESELRSYHQENLRSCDGALIFHGAGNEMWLRGKLREIKKSVGYGRAQPVRAVGICLIAPRTPEKESFLTHEAMLIPQWDGVSADGLQPFLSRLQTDADGNEEAGEPAP
jgi:hypothetical protein